MDGGVPVRIPLLGDRARARHRGGQRRAARCALGAVSAFALSACSAIFGLESPKLVDAGHDSHALDGPADAAPLGAFGPASPLFADEGFDDDDPSLTSDMLELYF